MRQKAKPTAQKKCDGGSLLFHYSTSILRLRGFIDWFCAEDSGMERLWIAPFAFYQKNTYFHFLPPLVYMNLKNGHDEYSADFWGVKVLFGWLCYERADTLRHFRLFPLAWYSWDQTSDNKKNNFLLFFYSELGNAVYHVLFPLNGLSNSGDSSVAVVFYASLITLSALESETGEFIAFLFICLKREKIIVDNKIYSSTVWKGGW